MFDRTSASESTIYTDRSGFIERLGPGGARALHWPARDPAWVLALRDHFGVVDVSAVDDRESHWPGAWTVLRGDALESALASGTYDLVFAVDGVRTPDPDIFLARAFSALKPGGRAFVTFVQPEGLLRSVRNARSVPGITPDDLYALADFTITLVGRLSLEGRHVITSLLNGVRIGARLTGLLRLGGRSLIKLIGPKDWSDPTIGRAIECMSELQTRLPTQVWQAIRSDLVNAAAGRPILRRYGQESAHEGTRICEAARRAGFSVVGAGPLGWVVASATAPPMSPLGIDPRDIGEVLLAKPTSSAGGPLSAAALRLRGRNAANFLSPYVLQRVHSNLPPDPEDRAARQLTEHFVTSAERLDRERVLQSVVDDVVANIRGDERRFMAVYRFIQDALFHHPVVQLTTPTGDIVRDPLAILMSGIGRCGHVAHVAVALFRKLGFDGRVTQLHKHLIAEIRDADGKWRVVDCDLFKAGTVPWTVDGLWPSLNDLRDDPVMLDAAPALGVALAREGAWARSIDDEITTGYVDSGLAWERPYSSYLYFGGECRFPARPVVVAASRKHRKLLLHVEFTDRSNRSATIHVGTSSRGWTYLEQPAAHWIAPLPADIATIEVERNDRSERSVVDIAGVDPAAPLFVNFTTRDLYAHEQRRVFAWPGEEVVVSGTNDQTAMQAARNKVE